MALEHIGKNPPPEQGQAVQQYDQGYGPDPYALPYDPYMSAPSKSNWNAQTMLVLFKTLDPETDHDIYAQMYNAIIERLIRLPNISKADVRRLNRDFADIEDLSACKGTKRMVASRNRKLYLELCSLAACGENPLVGMTSVGALVTTRQQQEQTIKMPQQQEVARKKIFGLI